MVIYSYLETINARLDTMEQLLMLARREISKGQGFDAIISLHQLKESSLIAIENINEWKRGSYRKSGYEPRK